MLDVLLAESHLIGGLTAMGLSLSDAHSLVQIPVHSQAESFAVDMRSQSVVVSQVEPLAFWTPMGQKKVSCLVRCPYMYIFRGWRCMQEGILGKGEGVESSTTVEPL